VKHLVHYKGWTGDEILELLEKAVYMKSHRQQYANVLNGKTMALIFQKTSTRTRVSFEAGMTVLGGHAIFLDWRTTNLIMAEIKDEIRYISGNADIVMARLLHNKDLQEMADYATVPVINGCCEKYHPCQGFADLLTVRERLGTVKGKKLVYVGVWNNVLNSLIDLCPKTGTYLTAVTPVINEPAIDPELNAAAEKSGFFTKTLNVHAAVKDADVVYTDSWVDMEFFLDPKFASEKEKRVKQMMPFQLNQKLLKGTRALVMHDMPIHPGYEIDRETIESPNAAIFQQSWNRMYGQNALILRLLGLI
jgi:ornithine carbamoyltransferase